MCSCVTTSPNVTGYNLNTSDPDGKQYGALFSEYNKYNGRVAMGISGPYSNKEEAIAEATLNCVQMLSFYRGLAMQTDMSTTVGVHSSDENVFGSISFGGTSDTIFQKTAEDMEIVEILWFGGDIGVAVFATLPEMEEIQWNYAWDNPVALDKNIIIASECSYETYSKYKNAIEAATFCVAVKLTQIDQNSINVNNTLIETTTTTFQNQSYSISGSKLEGFTVVAYVFDQNSRKVYAVAAARK